jgi:hypothetical protein
MPLSYRLSGIIQQPVFPVACLLGQEVLQMLEK